MSREFLTAADVTSAYAESAIDLRPSEARLAAAELNEIAISQTDAERLLSVWVGLEAHETHCTNCEARQFELDR